VGFKGEGERADKKKVCQMQACRQLVIRKNGDGRGGRQSEGRGWAARTG
jgi:hypothetical protein